MSLTDEQLEFICELCYMNRGMWAGDVNSLIRAEAKREVALFLKSIKDCTAEDLAIHFDNNGESNWIINQMTQ